MVSLSLSMEATSQSLAVGTITMGLFGGLALFLAGMEQMSQALKAVAGEGMRQVLSNLTRNRFMAAGTGAFVTAVIQSSSVTTVLVVGLAVDSVRDRDAEKAQQVIAMKRNIQSLAHDVNAHLSKRVVADEPNRVTAYRIETDAVEVLQRLYYFAKRVAKAVVDATDGDADAP